MASRQLKLAGFFHSPGSHKSGWRLPDAVATCDVDFAAHVRIAQTLERGKFDAIFYQDSAAVGDASSVLRGDRKRTGFGRVVKLEPMSLLPALAAVTKHLGLIATGTTTYNEPYHIARRFASIDHISNGRAGWNLVTSQNQEEAFNFGLDKHVDHALRYERAAEFYDVVVGLWDSWDDDAFPLDKENGLYFDADKLHFLQHEGKFFKVRGPLNVPRCPQGRPIVAQAGSSEPGRELAAKTADVVFTAQSILSEAQEFYSDVKGRMARYGRRPEELKILPGIVPLVGRTDAEAREWYDEIQSLITDDVAVSALSRHVGGVDLMKFPLDGPLPPLPPSNSAKGRMQILLDLAAKGLSIRELGRHFVAGAGHNFMYGSPRTIADFMQEWLDKEACDGFTVIFAYYPTPIDNVVDLLVPELQRRGIFRREYEGTTLRDSLGLTRPSSKYARSMAAE